MPAAAARRPRALAAAGRGGGRIRVRGVDGFGRRLDGAGRSAIVLPWCGPTTGWRVTATRRGMPGGMTSATVAACADGDAIACTLAGEERHGAPLSLTCGPGAAPGPAVRASLGEGNGLLWVSTAAADVDWAADSIG